MLTPIEELERPGFSGAGAVHWRAVNGPHLVALVRAGATFQKGFLVERTIETTEAVNPEPEKTAA